MAISERLQQRINNMAGMEMPQSSAPQMPMQMQELKAEGDMPMQKTPMQGTMSQREMDLLETAKMGRKGDTQLGHLEVGDVVVPPSVIANNPILDEMLESTMLNQGIDPQQRIVGLGLASLNPNTGLEEFGIFDSLTKGLEKFADRTGLKKLGKKLAPLAPIAAQFIPGGPIVSGAVGAGLQGLLGGQKPKDYLADAAMGAGIGALAQGATRGFTKEGMSIFDPNFVGPADPSKLGGGAPLRQSVGMDIIKGLQSGGIKGALGNLVDEGTLAGGLLGIGGGGAGQAIINEVGEVIGYTGGGGGLGGLLGGGLGMAGIGALSAGLAKLAYEDAKKQKGVPLTPLTTMSPTGRYNIEAEIARRQGLPAPNPVEFGLLPAGTLPKLSGGQPRGKNLGGAIEELKGGMARGMQEGGPADRFEAELMQRFSDRAEIANDTINELEKTFNPNNLYDLVTSNLPLVPESIENLLISEEKRQYDRAKKDFALSVLRRESGSVIPKNEIDYVDRTYFPQLGDDEETIELKKRARKIFTESLKNPQSKTKPEPQGIQSMMPQMYQASTGGSIMAFAAGGAVAMQEGGEMDPSKFPPMDGDINGAGTETSDDIPAMLSDGEFVMTARAVRGAGTYDMNQDNKGIITLTPSMEENRERGMDLMYKVMDAFSGQARPS